MQRKCFHTIVINLVDDHALEAGHIALLGRNLKVSVDDRHGEQDAGAAAESAHEIGDDGEETDACPGQSEPCTGTYITPTVPDALYQTGDIGSRSYSLYLDDVVEQKGSILFGAVDTAKFSGDLVTMATVKHQGPDGDGQNGVVEGHTKDCQAKSDRD